MVEKTIQKNEKEVFSRRWINNLKCFMKLKQFKENWENKLVTLRGVTIGSSSEQEHKVNALAQGAEEGRDKLRKATGSCKWATIRGYPNVETLMMKNHESLSEYIA